ncbi:MAG: hypothetical protein ABUK01_16535 [Leptospirales bacterium]
MNSPNIAKIIALLLLSAFASTTVAQIKYSIEVETTPEETQKKIEETLKKFNTPFKLMDKTSGFQYRTKTPFLNPFAMNIFVGEFNNKTVIRIDSPFYRTSRAFTDVLLQESGVSAFPVTYRPKSALLSIPLTLIAPSLGSWYTFAKSPLKPAKFWMSPFIYLGIDLVLLFIGGKTFFTHGFDPFDRGLISTVILLGTHRLFHMYLNISAVTAHNRLVKMGYTFQY